MKTAISIPDLVFTRAERLAKRLRVSRSELYVQALERYLRQYDEDEITERLNRIYGDQGAELDPAIAQIQFHSLPKDDWQ